MAMIPYLSHIGLLLRHRTHVARFADISVS